MKWYEIYLAVSGIVAIFIAGWNFKRTKTIKIKGHDIFVASLPRNLQIVIYLVTFFTVWLIAPLAVVEYAVTKIKEARAK